MKDEVTKHLAEALEHTNSALAATNAIDLRRLPRESRTRMRAVRTELGGIAGELVEALEARAEQMTV